MKNSFFLNAAIAAFTLLSSQLAFAGQAGTVTFKTGDVSITRADKTVIKAEKNVALNAGDTIETKDGRLQLSLIDGGKVSLQPNTIYKINKYEFSGKEDGTEYGFTELIKGGLRTISGLIGHKNRDRYQLKTAVATIGIRGTEFTVNFNNNQLLMTTNHGSVDVCNEGGCLNATTGQSIGVAGPGKKPKPSDVAATASAAAPVAEETKVASNDSNDSNDSKDSKDSKSNSKSDTESNSSSTSTSDTNVTSDAASDSGARTATDASSGAVADTNSGSSSTTTASNSGSGSSGSGSSGSGSSGTGSSTPVFTAAGPTTSTGIPTIIAPSMKDGPGTIVGLAIDTCGCSFNDIFNADLKFEKDGALKEAKNRGDVINPNKNNFVSYNSDGIVAWGQVTDAKYKASGVNINAIRFDYIAGATPSAAKLANLTGTYTVYGSTSPFSVSGASATTIGVQNAVNGSLNFDFTRYTLGYNLNVPTTTYGTFNLTGGGSIAAAGTFAATGTVTNAAACAVAACGGALSGNLIQGSFLGANGERIGLQYGINVPYFNKNIYGGAVLK